MELNKLADNAGARKKRMRVGRGIASGKGKTSGKGQKGQNSRSGVSLLGFEGGQMPLYRRLPKRGFKNPGRNRYVEVNLGRLQAAIDAKKLDGGKTVDAAALKAAGVIRRAHDGVRLLAKGELKAKVNVEVVGASKAAVEAVEKAGGKVVITAERAASAPKPKKSSAASKKKADKATDEAPAKADDQADEQTEE